MQRARGAGTLATQLRDGGTHLHTLYQDGCAKIRLPHTHDQSLEAVLINTAGGLTGGDYMRWQADIAPGSRATITTQACERIYRSTGATAQVETHLTVGAGAHLDWLPQETILFAKSRFERWINIDLAPDASLTAIEAVLLGRDAMGEDARDALFRDNWRIRRNGRLVHAEATHIDGSDMSRDNLALLAGTRAFATIIHFGTNLTSRLEQVRALLPEGAMAAASVSGERLVIRAMANSGLALRRTIVPILGALSRAGSLPRLWHL
ncbi:urease accessory protein UreD [Devosia sp. LC5]|uniref:urease accessory protein UreD n=1 Tax=Devosia sp. LC5 TaxID=1502724 RepID=UPI0005503A28